MSARVTCTNFLGFFEYNCYNYLGANAIGCKICGNKRHFKWSGCEITDSLKKFVDWLLTNFDSSVLVCY